MSESRPVGDIDAGETRDLLLENLKKITAERERLVLLQEINKRGKCTRDIMFFLVSQAKRRSVNKSLDRGTRVAAMRSKITDSKSVLAALVKKKGLIIDRYLRENKWRRFKLRKIIKELRSRIRPNLEKQKIKNSNKIIHLEKTYTASCGHHFWG